MGAESCLYRKRVEDGISLTDNMKTQTLPARIRKSLSDEHGHGPRVLIANSRSFDHDSWRTGQNCGYLQLRRTTCWRNGPSRRILERPELFLNWAQQSFHEHRTPSDASIATANRPTSSQARAPSSCAGQDYANFGIFAQTRPPFAPYPEIHCGAGASTRARAFYPRRTP